MNTLEKTITNHPFTKGLNPRYLHLLTGCATFERHGPGYELFREGYLADRFYLIQSGQVALRTFVPGRGVVTLETLTAGDILGWSWLFAPHRWAFTAVTVAATELAVLAAPTLRAEMEENHDFGYEVFSRMCQNMMEKLELTRKRMAELLDSAPWTHPLRQPEGVTNCSTGQAA